MSEVVSSADFQAKVLEAKGKVLVDFFATWCGPCRMVAPVIDEVAAEKAGEMCRMVAPVIDEVAAEKAGEISVYKVDIDQSPDIASRYGVMSVPTIAVFENGQIVRQTVGAQPKQGILALLS